MANWQLEHTDRYLRDHFHYKKKNPHELAAVLENLDTYFKALDAVGNPLQVTAGFLHPESDGIIAIDQRGGRRKIKLQQTRLYVYPDVQMTILHILTLGDKKTQRDDINFCRSFVKKLREGRDAKTI